MMGQMGALAGGGAVGSLVVAAAPLDLQAAGPLVVAVVEVAPGAPIPVEVARTASANRHGRRPVCMFAGPQHQDHQSLGGQRGRVRMLLIWGAKSAEIIGQCHERTWTTLQ